MVRLRKSYSYSGREAAAAAAAAAAAEAGPLNPIAAQLGLMGRVLGDVAGVALLSGFGGANTTKEGEKTTVEETDAEKRARVWSEMQKMQEKQKKLQEEYKADQEYIKKWQMERYQQLLTDFTNQGGPWAPFKALTQAAQEARAELQRRGAERQKSLGGVLPFPHQSAVTLRARLSSAWGEDAGLGAGGRYQGG